MLARLIVKIILRFVCAWAQRQEARILALGKQLNERELDLASAVGVRGGERVRVLRVEEVPLPLFRLLRSAGRRLGLVPATIGMALGHGIFVQAGHATDIRLLRHELAHVAQYERLGGLRPFLERYLLECLTSGYPFGELEQEAARISRID